MWAGRGSPIRKVRGTEGEESSEKRQVEARLRAPRKEGPLPP